MTTTELGRQAEQIVCRYFEDLGAVILEQNLRVKKYEIDLIVDLKRLLVVVELKWDAAINLADQESTYILINFIG